MREITKQKVTITLDKELVETIKKHNLKLSTLCNNLLLSLFTKPQSLNSHNLEVRGSSPRVDTFRGFRALRPETRVLKNTYFKHKDNILTWLNSKYSKAYCREVSNTLEKIFSQCESLIDIKKFIEKSNVSSRSISVSFRVFLNYCEQEEIFPDEFLALARKKIKLKVHKGVDSFVPTSQQISNSFQKIKEIYPKFEFFYKFMLESGCRFTELKHFILNFDEKNIDEWDDKIILYRNFYLRGNKSSYYLFISKETFEGVKAFLQTNVEFLHSFQDRTSKHKEIICVKYLRKWNFTLMVEHNIPFEIANFIQGRESQNVGFNNYLSKKIISVKEYSKILDKIKEIYQNEENRNN